MDSVTEVLKGKKIIVVQLASENPHKVSATCNAVHQFCLAVHQFCLRNGVNNSYDKTDKNQTLMVTMVKPLHVVSRDSSSSSSSQPIGWITTLCDAANCVINCRDRDVQLCGGYNREDVALFTVAVENGIVRGSELELEPKDDFFDVTAVCVWNHELSTSGIARGKPLLLPRHMFVDEPSTTADNLAEYRKFITPLLDQRADIYHKFSKGRLTREGVMSAAIHKALDNSFKAA